MFRVRCQLFAVRYEVFDVQRPLFGEPDDLFRVCDQLCGVQSSPFVQRFILCDAASRKVDLGASACGLATTLLRHERSMCGVLTTPASR